ncbi:hypothetical protein K438DRAFT_1805575 [Mycena galopus ATCC 62051]|nr:hypothetical protein K438DRAFT_1805575 [Mycena galopus ATCC 62051]
MIAQSSLFLLKSTSALSVWVGTGSDTLHRFATRLRTASSFDVYPAVWVNRASEGEWTTSTSLPVSCCFLLPRRCHPQCPRRRTLQFPPLGTPPQKIRASRDHPCRDCRWSPRGVWFRQCRLACTLHSVVWQSLSDLLTCSSMKSAHRSPKEIFSSTRMFLTRGRSTSPSFYLQIEGEEI